MNRYDTPIISAYTNNVYNDIKWFFLLLYSSALKMNIQNLVY